MYYLNEEVIKSHQLSILKKEFEEEVIAQIKSCKGLMDSLSTPGKLEYDYFNIWYDWRFDGNNVFTNEPKFVDSTNTRIRLFLKFYVYSYFHSFFFCFKLMNVFLFCNCHCFCH